MGISFSALFPELWNTRYPRGSSHNGIVIALIGRTGSGMSQFIHDATGSYETGVSPAQGLQREPYTVTIQDYGFTIPGIDFVDFPLIFIDTPGYSLEANDSDERSTLQELVSWLEKFKPHTELDGLIFMHNICTSEIKNRQFRTDPTLFSKLCGTDWAKKIVLLTTHWDQLGDGSADSKRQEVSRYWSIISKYGPMTEPYGPHSTMESDGPHNRRASAWSVLRPLVEVAETAREARLKKELDELDARLKKELGEIKSIVPRNLLGTAKSVLDRKTNFIKGIIARLGETVELTNEEKEVYDILNKEAQALWEKLEKEIDSAELERRLAAAPKRSPAQTSD